LPEENTPEIQRCPLDNLVISAKMLNMGTPVDILACALDPPDISLIFSTIQDLKEVKLLSFLTLLC
jgi:ATP-dependent RNA helicase TDRD9